MPDLNDLGLEYELDSPSVTPEYIPQQNKPAKKDSGILGKAVCLMLGFVIGAGGTIGGIAGAGYYVATQPIQNTVDAVNGITGVGINLNDFLTPSYASGTVMDLVGGITTVAQKFADKTGCLNDLAAISPYVSTAIDPLLDKISEYGLSLDREKLMATPVSELSSFLIGELDKLVILDFLEANSGQITMTELIETVFRDENGNKLTVGDVRALIKSEDGVESLVHHVPVDVILLPEGIKDEKDQAMMLALCYGNSSHYVIVDGQVQMNQMTFTLRNGNYYDVDGNQVTVTTEGGVLVTQINDKNVYLKADGENKFLGFEDAAFTTSALHEKTTFKDLMKDSESLLNEVTLASLLGLEYPTPSAEDEESDVFTTLFAFGEEGTHYYFDGEGNLQWHTDPETGKQYGPKTVGDLLENNNISDLFNDIKLATLFDLDEPKASYAEGEEKPNAIMTSLAYGEEGIHYYFDNGELKWYTDPATGEEYTPRTLKTLMDSEHIAEIFDDMRLATVLNIKIDDAITDENALTHAIAFGYAGTHYTLEGGVLDWLPDPNNPGQDYSYRTVKDMESMSAIIDDMRLGTVLGVEITDAITDENALTYAIAFGYEGTHYYFDNGELNWIGDNNYRTVKDMNQMGDIINELRIETALSVNVDSSRLLLALAYGSEGTDYKFVYDEADTNKENPIGITDVTNYNTISDLSNPENNLIDGLKLVDILGEDAIKDDLILSHLGNSTLETLPNAVQTLTFKQIYPDQIYATRYFMKGTETEVYAKDNVFYEDSGFITKYEGEVEIRYHYEYWYACEGDVVPEGASKVNDNNGNGGYIVKDDLWYHNSCGYYHYTDEATGTIYQVHLTLTGQWKYLLTETGDATGDSHDYTLTEFSKLVKNMTNNMTNATLNELKEDGIVSDLPETTLNADLLPNDLLARPKKADGTEATTLGELTITQILNYVALVLNLI